MVSQEVREAAFAATNGIDYVIKIAYTSDGLNHVVTDTFPKKDGICDVALTVLVDRVKEWCRNVAIAIPTVTLPRCGQFCIQVDLGDVAKFYFNIIEVNTMISKELKDAIRDATIGIRYVAYVLYSSSKGCAVVDTFSKSPSLDWVYAIDTAMERAVANSGGEVDIKVEDVTLETCNNFCLRLDLGGRAYYVNIVEIN